MEKTFDCGAHYLIKAVRKAGIVFPITKAGAIAKAGDTMVKVDFDRYDRLASIIETFSPEEFPNAESFYCAYVAAQMKQLKLQVGY